MSVDNKNPKQSDHQPLAQPSEGPLKNEPTPERAREEKEKQEEEACPKGS
jgi:hypothetical protein